jgi:CubicO group peptidase (beta-lactamase class C family)
MKIFSLARIGVLALFLSNAPVHAQPDQIRAVTDGLLPAVSLKGQPPLKRSLADEMKALHVPGVSIAVIHQGRIAWSQGFGVRQVGGGLVGPDTLFQAGSVSKPVAATGALHLVESGKLSLDTPVNGTLKDWKLPDNPFTKQTPVTLRTLLSHTAGTTVHGFQGYAAGAQVPTLVDVLNGAPPANSPPIIVDQPVGETYRYSGGGYTIMQKMVVDATGMTFPEVMKDAVLNPAGMRASTFDQPLASPAMSRIAWPHDNKGEPIPGGPHTYPEMAAAGLWTTAPDLAAYVIEMQKAVRGESAMLSAAMVGDMLTKRQGNWGMGFEIGGSDGNPYFYHDGSNAGYKATLIGYNKTGDGAVILTNGDQGFQLGLEILRSIASAYNWPDFHPTEREAVSLPLAQQLPFAGTFTIPDVGDFEIRSEGGRLVVEIWKGVVDPLYPTSPTSFFITSQDLQIVFTDPDRGTLSLGEYHAAFSRAKT